MCAQQRLRSAWAAAQSDQSSLSAWSPLSAQRRLWSDWADAQADDLSTAKTLIRLGGYPGWSESSPGAQSFCWFCHEAAQLWWHFWSWGCEFAGTSARPRIFRRDQHYVGKTKRNWSRMEHHKKTVEKIESSYINRFVLLSFKLVTSWEILFLS